MYTLGKGFEKHTSARKYVAVTDAKQMRNPRNDEGMKWGGEQLGTMFRPTAFALDLWWGLHGVRGSMARLIGSS